MPVVLPGGGMDADVAQVDGMFIADAQLIFLRRRHFFHGQHKGFDVLPAGHGQLGIHQRGLGSVGPDGLQDKLHAGFIAPGAPQALYAGQLQGADRGVFQYGKAENMTSGAGPVLPGYVQSLGGERSSRVAFRCGESQHADVPVVPPGFLGRLSLGELQQNLLTTGHIGAAPDKVPHGFFRFYPRTAGHGPAGTSLERETEAFFLCRAGHVAHHLLPLFREGDHRMLYTRPSATKRAVEPLYAAYSGFGNGGKVCLYALPGHVVTNEVEPGFRAVFPGRVLKLSRILRPRCEGRQKGRQRSH